MGWREREKLDPIPLPHPIPHPAARPRLSAVSYQVSAVNPRPRPLPRPWPRDPRPPPQPWPREMTEPMGHQRLTVYRAALDFAVSADRVVRLLPVGRAYLGDQLNRAASSIVCNIAEGAGEFSGKDKARFYRMARRSAYECAAVVHLAKELGLVDTEEGAAEPLLGSIAAMLTRMIVGLEGRGRGGGGGKESEGRGRGRGKGQGSGGWGRDRSRGA